MRAIFLLALVCLASIGELVSARSSNSDEWTRFKRQHGKVYADKAEDALRFSLFLAAKDRIERHNANASHTFKLGLNHFADWTQEERVAINGFRHREQNPPRPVDDSYLRSIIDDPTPVPPRIDWRENPDVVSPVLDQGHCASSFAFAAVGLLEGQQVARGFSKKLQPLSVGQALHCTIHSKHCYGGLVSDVLEDVHRFGGIETASDYPYNFYQHTCRFKRDKVFMKTSGGTNLPGGEVTLKTAVGLFGPVAAHIEVNSEFYDYKSGVFDGQTCNGTDLNQAVLVVGYDTDPKEGDFWILKNSWGTKWGENGYMRMRRGVSRCGLGKLLTVAMF